MESWRLLSKHSTTLLFSDVALFGAVLVAWFVANSSIALVDLHQTPLKHGVGMAALMGCFLYLVGSRIGVAAVSRGQWLSKPIATTTLALLGLYIISGSLFARIHLGIQETFFIVGAYIWIGVLFALCLNDRNISQASKLMFYASLVCGLAVCLDTIIERILNPDVKDTIIHEREFFAIPILYLIFFFPRLSVTLRIASAIIVSLGAVAALKNTPTIVLAITGAVILWRWYTAAAQRKRSGSVRRILYVFAGAVGVIAVLCGYFVFANQVAEVTPPGNIDFRQHQYQIAWEQFKSSPIYGSAFAIESGIHFNLWYDPRFNGLALPTHSDVLDLLRGGGLVAISLWFLPLAYALSRSVVIIIDAGRKGNWNLDSDTVAWLFTVNISAMVVYTFNPILAKTGFAALIWMSLALLLAYINRFDKRRVQGNG